MPNPLPRILGQVIVLASLVFVILTAGTGPAEAQTVSGPLLLFVENVGQWPASANGETIRFQVSGQSFSDRFRPLIHFPGASSTHDRDSKPRRTTN